MLGEPTQINTDSYKEHKYIQYMYYTDKYMVEVYVHKSYFDYSIFTATGTYIADACGVSVDRFDIWKDLGTFICAARDLDRTLVSLSPH